MRPSSVLVLPLALALLPHPAAAADDVTAVRTKVRAAMGAAKSFVADAKLTSGYALQTTFVAPDRFHSTVQFNGRSTEVYLIGSQGYIGAPDGSFRAVTAPPDFVATQRQLVDVPVDAVLADQTAGGVTYGRFTSTSAGPQHDQRVTCSYDKKTYRLAHCENASFSVGFSHYDDPANVVVAPAVAPAPAATP